MRGIDNGLLYITKAHGNCRDEKERGSIVLQLLYLCFWTCAMYDCVIMSLFHSDMG